MGSVSALPCAELSPQPSSQRLTNSSAGLGLVDATVRMIAPTMSAETWNRALQPNDGLPLGNEWD